MAADSLLTRIRLPGTGDDVTDEEKWRVEEAEEEEAREKEVQEEEEAREEEAGTRLVDEWLLERRDEGTDGKKGSGRKVSSEGLRRAWEGLGILS